MTNKQTRNIFDRFLIRSDHAIARSEKKHQIRKEKALRSRLEEWKNKAEKHLTPRKSVLRRRGAEEYLTYVKQEAENWRVENSVMTTRTGMSLNDQRLEAQWNIMIQEAEEEVSRWRAIKEDRIKDLDDSEQELVVLEKELAALNGVV